MASATAADGLYLLLTDCRRTATGVPPIVLPRRRAGPTEERAWEPEAAGQVAIMLNAISRPAHRHIGREVISKAEPVLSACRAGTGRRRLNG